MLKLKKISIVLLALVFCVFTIAAGADAADKPMGKLSISAWTGNLNSFQQTFVDLFSAKFPDVEVDNVITDTNTREQVMKTAIAAGDPPSVGFYWGTRLNSFSDIGMCLDLRDVLDPDLLGSVNDAMLQAIKGPNGEVYGLVTDAVYHTAFYNKEMMDAYGFEEPTTWAELTAIFERVKQDGIFGFSTNSASMQDSLWGMAYGDIDHLAGDGTSYAIADGEVSVLPGTPAGEAIRMVIEQVKEWYDAGYWYPGDGGINCTQDDGNAAFAQGRVIVNFNFSGAIAQLSSICDFEIGTFLKPTSSLDVPIKENLEPNVFFIPSNANEEQINSAVEFLKILLSQEAQQAVVDASNIPSVLTYEYTNISPILAEMLYNVNSGSLVPGLNPSRTSSAMQTFIKQQIFAAPLAGIMTIDETLEEMERIRLQAAASR